MAKFYENMQIARIDLVQEWDGKIESHWFEISLEPITDNDFQSVLLTVNWDDEWVAFNRFLAEHGWNDAVPDTIRVIRQEGNRRVAA